MKTLKINLYPELNQTGIKDAADFLSKKSVIQSIDVLNWPAQFSHVPACELTMARSLSSIFIHYKVKEKQIKAIYTNDHDPVWQDSCVEFFCQLPGSKTYFNFEFNCIGTCLATERISRTEDVNPLSSEKMSQIKRFSSLGTEPFEEKQGDFDWSLTVEIPFSILGIESDHMPEKLTGNFYKCGDGTSVPHYVSWSPIAVEKPDFHRPEYFGELNF